jgi:hypothetical protein
MQQHMLRLNVALCGEHAASVQQRMFRAHAALLTSA